MSRQTVRVHGRGRGCHDCGCRDMALSPGTRMQGPRMDCAECGRHYGWMSKTRYEAMVKNGHITPIPTIGG